MAPAAYLMEPPEGQVRTLVNPPSSAGGVLPCGIATTAIALIVVGLRIFTRKVVVKGVLGIDDYLCIAGMCFSFIFLGICLTLLNLGAGNHMWDIPAEKYIPKFWQTSIGATLTYAAAINLAKLSVLTFYLRISPDKWVRRAVHVLIALVCAYMLVYTMLAVFRCRPVVSGWDLTIEGECIPLSVLIIFLLVCSVTVDVFVLLLPIRIIQPLQIPYRQKIGLCVLFATGGAIVIVTIRRVTITLPILDEPDYTWALPKQLVLSFIEVNTSLVCVSAPALKPFCMRYVPFIVQSRLRSRAKSSKNTASGNAISQSQEKRKGQTPANESYELAERSETFDDRNPQDDEARLWPVSPLPNGVRNSINAEQDADSIESLPDRGLPMPTSPDPAQIGFSTMRSQSMKGISVTKETIVTYGTKDT
ncbi:Ff.00g118350.m01.CDS01 [Fusarium sp. VM40]|nr:Ff.00g118350.m01.CDS01 [Fusarium sp. VM40]